MSSTEYDFDGIRQVADHAWTLWDQDAEAAMKQLKTNALKADDLSAVPSCAPLQQTYAAALSVYQATLEGVRSDLGTFRAKLKKAADDMEARDQNAAASLQALSSQKHDYSSDARQTQARTAYEKAHPGQKLGGGDGQDDGRSGTGQPGSGGGGGGQPSSSNQQSGSDSSGGNGTQVYSGQGSTTPPSSGSGSSQTTVQSSNNPAAGDKPTV